MIVLFFPYLPTFFLHLHILRARGNIFGDYLLGQRIRNKITLPEFPNISCFFEIRRQFTQKWALENPPQNISVRGKWRFLRQEQEFIVTFSDKCTEKNLSKKSLSKCNFSGKTLLKPQSSGIQAKRKTHFSHIKGKFLPVRGLMISLLLVMEERSGKKTSFLPPKNLRTKTCPKTRLIARKQNFKVRFPELHFFKFENKYNKEAR